MKPETSADGPVVVADDEPKRSTLDDVLSDPVAPARPEAPGGCLIGECTDARHPSLQGRVQVRWDRDGTPAERWLPTLQGLPVRKGDRVVLLQPANAAEPLVTGVLDGFARRPEVERESEKVIELQRDRAVRVVGADGRPLLELFEGDSGPVVRVLHEDLELAAKGRLRLSGDQVQVEAAQGKVEIEASDDVVVRGEVIHLN